MATLNLKTLAAKLNDTCRRGLEGAAGLCMSRSNYNIEIEHWLVKLLEVDNTDLKRIMRQYNLDPTRVNRELMKALDQLRTGNARPPELSLEILDLMREGWVLASLEYNTGKVRSGYLLTALVNDRALSNHLRTSSPELAKLDGAKLQAELRNVIAGSAEDAEMGVPAYEAGPGAAPGTPSSKTPALDQFTLNLTERAQKGEIDPVVGRDFEIRQMIDILTRRRQNNPILAGEAGVGKTAVVEGLALRIVANDVPGPLQGVALRTLDLGLLQAGAGVKGEFENRLKNVIQEVKSSPQPIILFIDEAHTLIGAGGSAGQGDAANLLKPALARGELRTVAATTWAEYKKYFETDAALKRRFQVVKVDEPTPELGVTMLRGFAGTLEKHHKVRILDEAVEDAVKLSHRYITDRQLPDKAVSLLDTSCSRVALSQSAMPAALEDCTRELEHLAVEIDALTREDVTGADHKIRMGELQEKKAKATERKAELEKQLEAEKKLVDQIRDLRGKLEGTAGQPALVADEQKKARDELVKLQAELTKLQGETPLVYPVVDRQAVAAVVSGWTGIPIGKMVLDEIKTVLGLKERIEERVIGQSHALDAIAQRIRTGRANLADPRRPIGVFLLVGPSGVGKTETAIALSDILYGGDRNMVVINMSEYKEEHKISRLTGSAAGYVGYGEGGVLTESVRRKPYSIVLLDEVEKAHESIHEVFYQVFDKGTIQDDKGGEVNFKNTIILLTSNAGSDYIMKQHAAGTLPNNSEKVAEMMRPELLKVFKPALLGRMTVVPYFPLSDEVLKNIINLQLRRIRDRIAENYRAQFLFDETVVNLIASRCKEVETGARNADHIITGSILPELAKEFLSRMAEGHHITSARVLVDGNKIAYQID